MGGDGLARLQPIVYFAQHPSAKCISCPATRHKPHTLSASHKPCHEHLTADSCSACSLIYLPRSRLPSQQRKPQASNERYSQAPDETADPYILRHRDELRLGLEQHDHAACALAERVALAPALVEVPAQLKDARDNEPDRGCEREELAEDACVRADVASVKDNVQVERWAGTRRTESGWSSA